MRGTETRNHIKRLALRLFADRGVDNVSVRDIIAAADQRNNASLHYHFGGRDGLIKELVSDGARLIDEMRIRRVDALEAGGRVPTLRDAVWALAQAFSPEEDPSGASADYV